MEAAWKEVEHGGAGAGAGVGDPDLDAVWDDQYDAAGVETLEGVWGRTAARLEAGEGVYCTSMLVCICIYCRTSMYIYTAVYSTFRYTCIHT